MILSRIPENYFEHAGIAFGLISSVSIATQIYAELRTDDPSTLALPFLIGWLTIFIFWTLYGLRFKRLAVWSTNAIAVCVQTTLLVVVLLK